MPNDPHYEVDINYESTTLITISYYARQAAETGPIVKQCAFYATIVSSSRILLEAHAEKRSSDCMIFVCSTPHIHIYTECYVCL